MTVLIKPVLIVETEVFQSHIKSLSISIFLFLDI